MTDMGGEHAGDVARAARLAQLQHRRAPSTTRPATAGARASRPVVGSGSKVAAAGLGFASMLGLVAAMAISGRPSAATPEPASRPAAAPQQVVVVASHRGDGTATSADSSRQPIVLSAQPTVRPAPASGAPAGRTHGSR